MPTGRGGICMRLSLDFDGVICERNEIPRKKNWRKCKPMKLAKEGIWTLLENYEVYILTNRPEEEWDDIYKWLLKNGFPSLLVTNKKLPNTFAYIDDRAIRFTNWLDICKYFG